MSGSAPANSDLLMYFRKEASDSDALQAESTSSLNGKDSLTKDFKPGQYFQAENFSFGIRLTDSDGASSDRSFAKWRGLRDSKLKPVPPYRAEPDDVSITRMIDASSPLLLTYCLSTRPFAKVVLVKRARLGNSSELATVMRMEFGTVWLKAVEWEDNDAVMETCKFKFNTLDGVYVKRKPDGTEGARMSYGWRND